MSGLLRARLGGLIESVSCPDYLQHPVRCSGIPAVSRTGLGRRSIVSMRLGVLDVGSNTVHLLVVDAYQGARPVPAFSQKEELQLGDHLEDGTA